MDLPREGAYLRRCREACLVLRLFVNRGVTRITTFLFR